MANSFRGAEPGVVSPAESAAAAREARRLWEAMMLAPTVELAESLLRGDPVPLHRLDRFWVESFGLRE